MNKEIVVGLDAIIGTCQAIQKGHRGTAAKPDIIAVDFDGTCVDHRFPDIGPELPGAVETLLALHRRGILLILWTMRGDEYLQAAVDWFAARRIPLYGVNTNPDQTSWTSSPKAYAQVYIDDAAFGAPLIHQVWMKRPGIDWAAVARELIPAKEIP